MAVRNDLSSYTPESCDISQYDLNQGSPSRPTSTDETVIPSSVRKKLKKPRSASVNSSVLLEFCRNTKLLLVEDSPSFHLPVRHACEKVLGWDLTICATGQDGVAAAKANNYHIILMDVNLGPESDFNGYEAARQIKEIKPEAIIVSFSSESLKEKEIKGAHMNGHIDKNGASNYLLIALSSYIKQARLDKSLCFSEGEEVIE